MTFHMAVTLPPVRPVPHPPPVPPEVRWNPFSNTWEKNK